MLSILLVGLAFYQSSTDPIVVVDKCDEKTFHEGSRQPIKLGDDDIRRFIERWIRLRYTWKSPDSGAMLRAIEPVSTDGFRSKVSEFLAKQKTTQGGKEQQVEESVANIEVALSEKDAIASFDRIVRINGIPIVVPSQVSLQIVQGKINRWNPLGLYVNGALEHEDK